MPNLIPNKAVILSAGMGTRLYPVTNIIPKPMMPFWNVPLLEHTLRMLKDWKIKECMINTHYLPNAILRHILDRQGKDMHISLTYEPQILGTGGTVTSVKWFTGDEPFWLINGDIIADIDPIPICSAFRKTDKCIASAWLVRDKGPKTVRIANGMIADFRSKPTPDEETYTFCGVQVVHPDIRRYMPRSGFSTIVHGYENAIKHGRNVAGVVVAGSFWSDIGNPKSYIETHKRVYATKRLRRIFCRGQTNRGTEGSVACISPLTQVSRHAKVINSVIWKDCIIGANAVIKDSIVCNGVSFNATARNPLIKASDFDKSLMSIVADCLNTRLTQLTVMPLEPRGSARSFFRIFNGRKSYILIRYTLERPENSLYCQNAQFLQDIGVTVPKVIYDNPLTKTILMEDAGENSLLALSKNKSHRQLIRLYHLILDAVHVMHDNAAKKKSSLSTIELSSPFDRSLYEWEHNLFSDHFLKDRMYISNTIIKKCLNEMKPLADILLCEPQTLVHRDFQSTNIIFKEGRPYFIDFQGMRIGSAVYDIASLVADPYVSLSLDDQHKLVEYYAKISGRNTNDFFAVFNYAVIQRLIQAIGAISRLGARPETASFNEHLYQAVVMLAKYMDNIKGLGVIKKIVYSYLQENKK